MAINQFTSPEGDLDNYLITESWLIDQWVGDTLWTWGNNYNGQLGDNTTENTLTPVTTFAGGTNWKQVAIGFNYTAAIKTDGTLWTWGRNGYGQLGNNTTSNRATPVTTFAGGNNWKQVACGGYIIAAIKTDGTLWTWGSNGSGILGDNTSKDWSYTPVTTFAGGTNWKQISCGSNHTAAIKTDGTLWTWGRNDYGGRLGNDSTTDRSTPVTTFEGGTNWKQVSAGYENTAAIKTDGTLWTWGNNYYGELGINVANAATFITISGTMSTNDSVFYAVDLNGLTAVNLFDYSYISNNQGDSDMDDLFGFGNFPYDVIDVDTINNTITFGSVTYLGPGFTGDLQFSVMLQEERRTPVTTFAGGTNWKQVSCGGYHTAAIKTDGTLWTWGRNYLGQLGDNTNLDKLTPVTTFAGGTNWKQVAGGGNHTVAIKTDGTLWTWGRNGAGNLGDNDTTNRSTPVTTFAGGTNWKQVSTGGEHTSAVTSGTDPTFFIS